MGARAQPGEDTIVTTEPVYVSGPLLLADISGYTSFLQNVATEHRDDAFLDGVPDHTR